MYWCIYRAYTESSRNSNGLLLWGNLKKVAYSSKPRSLDELKVRITNEISEQQLHNVFNESEYRFELCVLNDVSHGVYVEDSRSDLQCLKTVGIKVLCGVYSVGLSCAHSKLLKFKFAQGLYVHPVCVCVCACVSVCVRARCVCSTYKTCAII